MSHLVLYPPVLAARRDPLVLSGEAPDGYWGDEYTHTYQIAGGRPPYTVTLESGSLPPGVTLGPATVSGPASGNWTVSGTLTLPI